LIKKYFKKSTVTALLGLALLSQAATASAATTHKATANDTFWTISSKYGISLDVLMKANSNIDPLNIYEGLEITIPSKADEAPAGATAAFKTAAALSAQSANVKAKEAANASPTLNLGGRIFNYSDALQVKASAYTSAASENGPWGPVDYFGNPLKLGTIAVDPTIIPLGSKVYVTGYNYDGLPQGGMIMIASDKGGSIKGNRIDIYVPHSQQKAKTFGYQYVDVFILE